MSYKKLFEAGVSNLYISVKTGLSGTWIHTPNRYGVVSESGKVIIPFDYENIFPFHEGLAEATYHGKSGYIDINNKVIIPFIYDENGYDKRIEPDSYFLDGVAQVRLKGKPGAINKAGNIIVPFIYDDITRCKNAFIVKMNGKYGLIDFNGNELCECKYDSIVPTSYPNNSEHVYNARINNKHYELDSFGKVIFEGPEITKISPADLKYIDLEKYEMSEVYSYGIKVRSGNKWGVINIKGDIIIPLEFDDITTDKYDMAYYIVVRNNKYGIFDCNSKKIIDTVYDKINWLGRYFSVLKNDKYALINSRGLFKTEFEFDEIKGAGYWVHFRKGNKWGAYSTSDLSDPFMPGIWNIACIYDKVECLRTYLKIFQNNCVGLIDNKGSIMLDTIYEEIEVSKRKSTYYDDFVKFKLNGKYGMYNVKNRIIVVPAEYDEIKFYVRDTYEARKGNVRYDLDVEGRTFREVQR
ncbi:MAG: WG repeat-containing protein [Clostridiales bacterium]